MKIFAELDENNIVVRVIKAEQSFIDTLGGVWVEDTDQIKNTACIGSKYDEEKNAFILPCSSPSWSCPNSNLATQIGTIDTNLSSPKNPS
jgi:hypothetical protein